MPISAIAAPDCSDLNRYPSFFVSTNTEESLIASKLAPAMEKMDPKRKSLYRRLRKAFSPETLLVDKMFTLTPEDFTAAYDDNMLPTAISCLNEEMRVRKDEIESGTYFKNIDLPESYYAENIRTTLFEYVLFSECGELCNRPIIELLLSRYSEEGIFYIGKSAHRVNLFRFSDGQYVLASRAGKMHHRMVTDELSIRLLTPQGESFTLKTPGYERWQDGQITVEPLPAVLVSQLSPHANYLSFMKKDDKSPSTEDYSHYFYEYRLENDTFRLKQAAYIYNDESVKILYQTQ